VKVTPLQLHLLMLAPQECDSLAATLAALHAARDTSLGLGKLLFRLPVMVLAWSVYHVTIGR
jgi:hypothetical protein